MLKVVGPWRKGDFADWTRTAMIRGEKIFPTMLYIRLIPTSGLPVYYLDGYENPRGDARHTLSLRKSSLADIKKAGDDWALSKGFYLL